MISGTSLQVAALSYPLSLLTSDFPYEKMMRRIILMTVAIAMIAAVVGFAVMIMSRRGEMEVELELRWMFSEGKYIPMNITVGDVVYGDGVEVKIIELSDERREGEEPNIIITRTARGVVLRGEDVIRENMELHVLRNGVVIPEICIPAIKVKSVRK